MVVAMNKEGYVKLTFAQTVWAVTALLAIAGGWWDIRWRLYNVEEVTTALSVKINSRDVATKEDITHLIETRAALLETFNVRLELLENGRRTPRRAVPKYEQPDVYGQRNHNN